MPLFNLTYVILGCIGGILPEALRIIKNMHNEELPSYLKRLSFWLGFLLMIIIGGFAAWIFEAENIKEALIYGFAAPEFFSKLASKKPESTDRAATDKVKFSLREWWW